MNLLSVTLAKNSPWLFNTKCWFLFSWCARVNLFKKKLLSSFEVAVDVYETREEAKLPFSLCARALYSNQPSNERTLEQQLELW